ncbi:MAG: DUF1559 domain-containing protein [Gemmataceae bacterium]|nr:DUF1559 domain-containing protein [Gemmataceae bacterium]MCI0743253.1 DUF1559 domain-containing protein [Gemmataceae bacterium]
MKKTLAAFVLVAFCWTGRAGDAKTDGATHGKVLAPYVDEDTFLLVHLDVSRANIEAVFERVKELGAPKHMQEGKAVLEGLRGRFLKAGGKDAYALWNWGNAFEDVLVVATVTKDGSADKVAEVLSEIGPLQAKAQPGLVVAGTPAALARLKDLKSQPVPALAKALDAAGKHAAQVVFVPPSALKRSLIETFPDLPNELGGGKSEDLAPSVLWAAGGLSVGDTLQAKLVIQSQDARAAERFGQFAEKFMVFAQLQGAGAVPPDLPPDVLKLIPMLTPKVQGDRLVLDLGDREFKNVIQPAIAKVQNAAKRQTSANNLKQIGLAMHIFHDNHRSFPPAVSYDAKGKPLLSWRVHVLPFLDQAELYLQFKLDEPWDSDHNKKLIAKIPEVFVSPEAKKVERGKTTYLVPVGPRTIFSEKKGTTLNKITDGTSNTILAVDAEDSRAVFWTQPDDYKLDPKQPIAGLVRPDAKGFQVLFADGSVRFIASTVNADTLNALFTMDGGEVIQND